MSLLNTLEGEAASAWSDFLNKYAATDLGAAAMDAVEYAADAAEGDDAKREVAKTQLLNALGALGKDLAQFSASVLNAAIEVAFQAAEQGLVAAVA